MLGLLFLNSTVLFAQSKDSVRLKAMTYVADKFPLARPLNIEYSNGSSHSFASELEDGTKLPDSKVKKTAELKASVNLPILRKKKWSLSTTLSYKYITSEIDLATEKERRKDEFHHHSESVNFSYFSKLFNQTTIYTASAVVDGSEEHFERFSGIISANMVLKATVQTQMTVGLLAVINPNALFPLFPTFTYRHQFNNGWIADVVFPKGAYMRKNMAKDGRFSAGTELGSTFFYLYDAHKTYAMTQVEINTGVQYEHYLGHSLIATFKTGMKNVSSARIYEKNDQPQDYLFKANPKSSFYIQAGISFNPFGRVQR